MNRIRLTVRATLALLCLAAAAPPATTPTTHPAPPPPPPVASQKARIDLTAIDTAAVTAGITLRQVTADAAADRTPQRVRDELPSLTVEIDARLTETADLLESWPSLQVLDGLADDWGTIDRTLDGMERGVAKRLDVLHGLVDAIPPRHADAAGVVDSGIDDAGVAHGGGRLAVLEHDWSQAGDVAEYKAEHPEKGHARDPAATNRLYDAAAKAADTVQQITLVEVDLRQQLTEAYAQKHDVDFQRARVTAVLDSVRRARDDAWDRLFQRDGDPIWQLQLHPPQPATTGPGSAAKAHAEQGSFARQRQAVWAYLRRHGPNVDGHVALVAVLAAALIAGRRWVRKSAEADPSLNRAMLAFTAPIATAIVLSFLVGVLIYPHAPRLFWAGFGAAILLPTVYLLRRTVERRLFRILYGLVAFYAVDQVRLVAASVPLLARGLFLAEMGVGAVLLALLVWSRRDIRPADVAGWVIRVSVRTWMAVFAACFVGDAVGFVSLAELVGGAALGGAYLAVILYACTRIVSGLLVLVLRSRPLTLLNAVRRHQPLLLSRLSAAVAWVAAAFWAVGVLAMLSARPAVFDAGRWFWRLPVHLGAIQFTPSHVLVFALTLYASLLVSRFVQFLLDEDVYSHVKLGTGLAYAINRIVHYVIVVAGIYIALAAANVPLAQFTLVVGALTVGLGFGLQNVVNNFVSGLILLFERPIKVGDLVQMADTTGTVEYIGIRASIIRTPESSEVIVPNGNLLSNQLTNWTLSTRQRGVSIPMNLSADADPSQVMRLLTDVAAAHPMVVTQPAPQALLMSFTGAAFSYELRAWTNSAEQWAQLRSELSVAVHARLVAEGIGIK